MCGRAVVLDANGVDQVEFGFTIKMDMEAFGPRYNLCPTEQIPVVHLDPERQDRIMRPMRWSLIPSTVGSRDAKEVYRKKHATFNARIEGVATSPSYRDVWCRQRALVVIDGIIEWVGVKPNKVPHLIQVRGNRPFAIAGMWDRWIDPADGSETWSCTMVTQSPSPWFARVHNRMAVILRRELYDRWLDPELTEPEAVRALIERNPFPDEEFTIRRISTKVNIPRYDAPDCLDPAA